MHPVTCAVATSRDLAIIYIRVAWGIRGYNLSGWCGLLGVVAAIYDQQSGCPRSIRPWRDTIYTRYISFLVPLAVTLRDVTPPFPSWTRSSTNSQIAVLDALYHCNILERELPFSLIPVVKSKFITESSNLAGTYYHNLGYGNTETRCE